MNLLLLSSYLSLVVQLITGLVGINGIFANLKKEDLILISALKLETLVQLIEFIFYLYLIHLLTLTKTPFNITSIRYFDWMITTPTMLISTIIYLKYQEYQESKTKNNNNQILDFWTIINQEKNTIIKILIGNWLMLLFGYIGEISLINLNISVAIGFIFFSYTFKLLYSNYAIKSIDGLKLYYFMFFIWSLYGIAAVFDFVSKNISYNILDLFSKNFYGLFLYIIIKSKSIN